MGEKLDPKSFWENMDTRLVRLGHKQPWLEEAHNISVGMIRNAKSRAKKDPEDGWPTVDNAYRIAKALDVSVEFLMTGSEASASRQPENEALDELLPLLRALPEKQIYKIVGALAALGFIPPGASPGGTVVPGSRDVDRMASKVDA